MGSWIGVDLDGTLAHYEGGVHQIGKPVPLMARRVRKWLSTGVDVRIMTARVSGANKEENNRQRTLIQVWCMKHLGQLLPITNCKDYGMIELWDDRAVQVIPNTGRRADEQP